MDGILQFWQEVVLFFRKYLFTRLRWQDFVDILILGILIFGLYRFIRDRRASKLALGFLVLAAVFGICSALDMKAMGFISRNFYQVGIIAVFIVFQPEVRSVLEKVGTVPISNLRNVSGETGASVVGNSVSMICEAACDMSMEKTGALIVIERTTKLGDHIKTGTILNAQLSVSLLKNIFFNKAPLHDGAVILRDYRIFSAGCFLPLSTKEDIIRDLGTRHRAAIGISELSDAVVIVVSEETGNISVAVNGTLKRNYNYRSLKAELTELLIPNTEESSSSASPEPVTDENNEEETQHE